MAVVNLLLSLASCAVLVQGARILAVLPAYWRSHHRFHQPLLAALVNAGHDVTVYSPFPQDPPLPNLKEFILESVVVESDDVTDFFLDITGKPHYFCTDHFLLSFEVMFRVLEDDKIKQLMTSEQKFDLVITEAFSAQEFYLIFGHIFKAPVIVLQAFMTNNVVNDLMGNELYPSYIPDVCTQFTDEMSFMQRFLNALYSLRGVYYVYHGTYLSQVESMMRSKFPDMPPLMEMVSNVSLVFTNDHMTADYAQPRTPNIIPVAGIHILEENPLPQDIKSFMDEAKEGVILFSLGTYTPDQLQPKEYFDMIVRVFKVLPQRVLWKSKKEYIEGLPDNVKIVKWLPQRDVLAHPNCVLFITHGGLLSQHEAVHSAVPVVAIPQWFDQHRNGKFYEHRGVGVRLYPEKVTESTLSAAISTVLGNPMYKTNMVRLSRVFRDRPVSPEKSVVFWTQYVLDHGSDSLRSQASRLHWYQRTLLDVVATVLAAAVMVLFLLWAVVKKMMSVLRNESLENGFEKNKLN